MPYEDITVSQLTWLQSKAEGLLAEVSQQIEEIKDPAVREALSKLYQLTEISQQIQVMGFVNVLSKITENQAAVDDELQEISEYLEAIVAVHMKEAKNLEKIM